MSFIKDAEIVVKALDDYRRESIAAEKPVIDQPPLAKLIADLDLKAHVAEGDLTGDRLSVFVKKYLAATTRLHHPGYLAHQVAVPHSAGALAALIDGFTNNPMAIYEMGPGAAGIEHFVINRLLEKVGWQPAPLNMQGSYAHIGGGGVLTHGGSLANLTAMLAARSHIAPEVWDQGHLNDLALLVPAESHYSIARAAGIMGIGQRAVYPLEVDDTGVVIPDRLPAVYRRLQNEGKRAVALVANACSTAVGLYDPLREIGEFCRENNLWLHVDGAHGASALFSSRHKKLLDGVEMADSLVWDAHKLMRTPILCAAVLVRDHRTLDNAFQQEASYLFHDKERPGFDFIHRTVECTKAGLGLKFFAVLAALGEQGLADYIDGRFQLALEAYEYISSHAEFECPAVPQCNIVCFRIRGSDQLQLSIRDKLISQGDFYLSTTVLGGKRFLRLVFMNQETGMNHIKALIKQIQQLADRLTSR